MRTGFVPREYCRCSQTGDSKWRPAPLEHDELSDRYRAVSRDFCGGL
jgi:hypothetical protein